MVTRDQIARLERLLAELSALLHALKREQPPDSNVTFHKPPQKPIL